MFTEGKLVDPDADSPDWLYHFITFSHLNRAFTVTSKKKCTATLSWRSKVISDASALS